MQNDLIQIFKINSNKIFIIPHGVCFEYDKKITKEKSRRLLNIREKYVILFFGLVREYKGLWYLIRAFEKFYKDFDAALLIAGDFIEGKEKYEKLINDLKIRDSVYIQARYIKDEEVPVFFAASDLLIQPYLNFSGQSGVPQTAYYYSLPIVASDVGGLPEIVLNKKTGLIVEPKNIDQISDSIKFFLKNPNKIVEYGENGKRFLEQELSWDSIVEKILNIYSNTNN
jgi:glycosyltransferase involved in cell wall biosynthesis